MYVSIDKNIQYIGKVIHIFHHLSPTITNKAYYG
jgi:hypothetical protein